MAGFNFTLSDGTPMREDEIFVPEEIRSPEIIIIADTIFKQKVFKEYSNHIKDEKEYKRPGSDPGTVLVFNQQKFLGKDFDVRTGTNRDVNELILTFQRLGFNIDPSNICNNFTRKEILDKLKQVSLQDHSDRNSLIVIILTHGDTGDMLQARDAPIWTTEVWKPFATENCLTLKDKPKFFVFQACKGGGYSVTSAIQPAAIPNAFYTTDFEPDMLLVFAAVEGAQSYRHMFNGTWFIQEMCRNFASFGRRDDVVSLLIRTTKCVATNYYHMTNAKPESQDETVDSKKFVPQPQITKQMPLFLSTLTKKFYLNRSKDRNVTLTLLQQQRLLVKAVKEMEEKVDKMYGYFEKEKKQKFNHV